MTAMCHCGQPLHYLSVVTEARVQDLVDTLGEYMTVTVAGRSWKVQRHYIALHGLEAWRMAELGFEEIQ